MDNLLPALVGGGVAYFGYEMWAPKIGYTDMFPRGLIALGLGMGAYSAAFNYKHGNKRGAEAAAMGVGISLVGQYFLAPVLESFITTQWLSALLLGPAVAVVAGLVFVELLPVLSVNPESVLRGAQLQGEKACPATMGAC